MNKNVFRLLLLFAIILSASCSTSYAVREKPAEVIYLRPAPPGPDYVWVSGDWIWAGKKYEWHEGHYELRRPGSRWFEGHWTPLHGGWAWVPGRWRRY